MLLLLLIITLFLGQIEFPAVKFLIAENTHYKTNVFIH